MAKILNVQFLVISKLGNLKTVHLVSPLDSFANDIPLLFLGHYDERELEHYVSLVPCTGNILSNLHQSVTNRSMQLSASTSTNAETRTSEEVRVSLKDSQLLIASEKKLHPRLIGTSETEID